MKIVESELDTLIRLRRELRSISNKDLNNLSWPLFLKVLRASRTPQSYTSKLEERIFKNQGWKKVPSREGRGDAVDSMGFYYEIKISWIVEANSSVNMVQLRPWQNLNGGYYIVVIEEFSKNIHIFKLSKKEMEKAIKEFGSSAHGELETYSINERPELAIRFPWYEINHPARKHFWQYHTTVVMR